MTIAFSAAVSHLSGMTVDQAERRKEIARVAIDLIASEGLAAATIRRIASEAGSSTTPITHYFDDKHELLVYTFDVLSKEGERQFEEALIGDSPDPVGPLLTMVPWCPSNVRRWKAYLAFWDGAARNAELAVLMRQSTRTGMTLLRRLVEPRRPPGADLEIAGELLSGLVQGLSMQMLVDPASWPVAKVRARLADSLELALMKAGLR